MKSPPYPGVYDDVVLAGGVRPDGSAPFDTDIVRRFGRRTDGPFARPEGVRVGLDVVVMNGAVRTRQRDCRRQELVGAVGEIHHDAVGPPLVVGGDLAYVATDTGDVVGDAVSLGVAPEIVDSCLVDVRPDTGRTARCEGDHEGTDTGEHIERPLALVDLLDDPVALCGQSGGEVHLGEVEFEGTAVLPMEHLGGVAGQNLPVPNPFGAFDFRSPVQHALDGEVRPHDGVGYLPGSLGVVLIDDDQVTQSLVAGGKAQLVGGHRLALTDRRVELDNVEAVRHRRRIPHRDVQRAVLDGDVVAVVDGIRLGETLSGRLALRDGHTNAGNAHTCSPPPAAVSLTLRVLYPPRRPTPDMLTFVGLGLYDERSVTIEGRDAITDADRVFAEFYTSRLVGTDLDALEAFHDADIEVRDRAGVEQDPEPVLDAAGSNDVVFLTAGDTMVSTTHTDLRVRAEQRGIETRVVHGTTAQTAAGSLTGLQNYRFGKATTLPFEAAHGGDGVPDSVLATIEDNRERDLHTLVYLDIKVDDPHWADSDDTYMTADHAAELLSGEYPDRLGVVVAQAGSPDPLVVADTLENLAGRNFGAPLHLLVIPADRHPIEDEALSAIAD